jgi:hypothetical protein
MTGMINGDVSITDDKDTLCKNDQYEKVQGNDTHGEGGEKRGTSVAIATVHAPAAVFLFAHHFRWTAECGVQRAFLLHMDWVGHFRRRMTCEGGCTRENATRINGAYAHTTKRVRARWEGVQCRSRGLQI